MHACMHVVYGCVCVQPPKVKAVINSVQSTPLANIQNPLAGFHWDYDKVCMQLGLYPSFPPCNKFLLIYPYSCCFLNLYSFLEHIFVLIPLMDLMMIGAHCLLACLQGDFYHWVELLNHFEVFFETFIKPRKDLQLEGNFLEGDDPFPKEAVLQILRVTQIILENCANKYLYNSNEVVLHPIPHFSAFFFLLLEHCFVL